MAVQGATLRFQQDAVVCLAGARMRATLDGVPASFYEPIAVRAGQTLALGKIDGPGLRTYLCVRHGFDVPLYLGSASTFTLGGFGGHGGRCLRPGDVLHVKDSGADAEPQALAKELVPELSREWELSVLIGPHGAPDFFTEKDMATLFGTAYEVHFNSARTGVRLIGPKPEWARTDGGEAGLHPSNIHDNAYAIGSVDFTGDMPILLGPDGPSLGGFVCPATVVQADLWKMGQLRPGDRVRFRAVERAEANAVERARDAAIAARRATAGANFGPPSSGKKQDPVLHRLEATESRPSVVYRQAGDRNLLVEYGPLVLDLNLRFRVHALMVWLEKSALEGVLELTPGIRSLQIQFDSRKVSIDALLERLVTAEDELGGIDDLEVPTRIVRLPISWDDQATRLAIEKYMQIVRKDAPWCPSNLEFIRRINGLDSLEDVMRIFFAASYLVLGLGDVYLGAPVATPVDPRHRLVTTKYNPARTWTPENAVGIGGAYLCIYGMEGPGGYQFVGRTIQVYSRYRQTKHFAPGKPWLLRFFDQLRFYPVSHEELLAKREAHAAGRLELDVTEETFKLRDYTAFLTQNAESIAAFKARQQGAFEAERQRWVESGQLNFSSEDGARADESELELPPGSSRVESQVPGSVWKVNVKPGARVEAGQTLVILESMKMEISVEAPVSGTVSKVLCAEGRPVSAGDPLLVIAS
jgi:urea carboxylase